MNEYDRLFDLEFGDPLDRDSKIKNPGRICDDKIYWAKEFLKFKPPGSIFTDTEFDKWASDNGFMEPAPDEDCSVKDRDFHVKRRKQTIRDIDSAAYTNQMKPPYKIIYKRRKKLYHVYTAEHYALIHLEGIQNRKELSALKTKIRHYVTFIRIQNKAGASREVTSALEDLVVKLKREYADIHTDRDRSEQDGLRVGSRLIKINTEARARIRRPPLKGTGQ